MAMRAGISPLAAEQAQQDFKLLENGDWLTGYANVWSLALAPWLNA
jgi:hypothetical protein